MQFKATTRTHYRLPSPAAFAAGGVALIVLVVGSLWLAESREPLASPALSPLPRLAAPTPSPVGPTAQAPARLVCRDSVLPGGVRGAADLASKLAHDPVARVHYANFNVARASLIRVEKSRLVHVSYRIGDKIYWTKNKVRLAAGEELLTDGAHLVRTRCGNRIADSRQAMESSNEPAPDVLDALMVSADSLTGDPENLVDPSAGVTNFTAPAAALLAPAAQVRLFPLHTLADLAPPNTGLYPILYAPLPASLAAALPTAAPTSTPSPPSAPTTPVAGPVPAGQPGPGDDQLAAGGAVADAPSPPSTASIPAPPVSAPTLATPPVVAPEQSGAPVAAGLTAGSATDTGTPVPEPGSSALGIAALIALALARRRAIRRK
jgi:hypothetical protein